MVPAFGGRSGFIAELRQVPGSPGPLQESRGWQEVSAKCNFRQQCDFPMLCIGKKWFFFPFFKYSSCTVPIRMWASYRSHLVGRHQSDLRTQFNCRYKRCRRRMRLWVGVFALIISSLYSTFGLDCVSSEISGKPAIDCDGSSDAWVFMLLVISTLLFS